MRHFHKDIHLLTLHHAHSNTMISLLTYLFACSTSDQTIVSKTKEIDDSEKERQVLFLENQKNSDPSIKPPEGLTCKEILALHKNGESPESIIKKIKEKGILELKEVECLTEQKAPIEVISFSKEFLKNRP